MRPLRHPALCLNHKAHWPRSQAITAVERLAGASAAIAGMANDFDAERRVRRFDGTGIRAVIGAVRVKLATVTNQGKTRWMMIDEAFDSDKRIEFLETLIKDAGRKVSLILDNLRVHHSQPVEAWAIERQGQDRTVLPAQLRPRTEPRGASQCPDLKHAIGTEVPVCPRPN